MSASYAAFVHRRRWLLLGAGALLLALASWLGPGVERHLSVGGFEDPRSESARAAALLGARFGIGPPDVALVYRTRGDPDALVAALAEPLAALRRHPGCCT